MKKYIINNSIILIDNEKINILTLENKDTLEKYILYININEIDKEISKYFNKLELNDSISVTPKNKFVDLKM